MTLTLEVILVIAALFGGTLTSGAGAFMTYWFGQRAVRAARRQELAAANAQEDAAKAQAAALEAAKQLVEVAKITAPILQEIKETGQATHAIVNNDRSVTYNRIASLTELIARLLPGDKEAAQAAVDARAEADRLPKPVDPA